MNEDLRSKLEDEVSKANAMSAAYNQVLGSFFENKQAQLFQAFAAVKSGDVDGLVGIHNASKALMSLELEIQGVIDSGKLAAAQIKEDEEGTAL